MRIAALLALSLALAACTPAPQQAPTADAKPQSSASSVKDFSTVVLKLERGPCYGQCPIYTVEIHGDGSVVFDGVNFVAAAGRQTGQVPVEDVRALVAKFEAAKFHELKDEYRGEVTDGATYKTTFAHDGQSKTVIDYIGHLANMPPIVNELESAIDALAGTDMWVKG